MNPAPPSPESEPQDRINATEVSTLISNASLARVQMQQRCGEMSLHVTEVLGAAIAAMISANASKSITLPAEFVQGLTRGLLLVYAFIQTLITANYVYHTFQIQILNVEYNQLIPRLSRFIDVGIGQLENDDTTSRWLRWGSSLVRSSQPLIPAFSALLAWPAFFYFLSVWPATTLHLGLWVIASVVFIIVGLLFLWWLREHMTKFAVFERRKKISSSKAEVAGQTVETQVPKGGSL